MGHGNRNADSHAEFDKSVWTRKDTGETITEDGEKTENQLQSWLRSQVCKSWKTIESGKSYLNPGSKRQ